MAKFTGERWHRNGFNLCEVIVIRDGPDAEGRSYVDSRHQIRVKLYETMEDAEKACEVHNRYIPE